MSNQQAKEALAALRGIPAGAGLEDSPVVFKQALDAVAAQWGAMGGEQYTMDTINVLELFNAPPVYGGIVAFGGGLLRCVSQGLLEVRVTEKGRRVDAETGGLKTETGC